MPSEEELEANKKAVRDVMIWDMLNPKQPRAEDIEKERRLSICEQCQFFRTWSRTCRKCGCFMDMKVTLDNAKCPMHKW
jgi:hypothetical protein